MRCPGNSCLLSRTHETVSKSSWLSRRLSFCCLRSWCLVLLSGPPVGSVVWFCPLGLFLSVFVKEATTQGTDPRTDLQAGIPKYVRFTWTWDWLLGISSSRCRPTGRGQWKSLHVQSGLSVEIAPFYTVTVGTVYVETVQSSHRLGWSTQASEDADASCSSFSHVPVHSPLRFLHLLS